MSRRKLHAVCVVPPPVTGQTLVTNWMLRQLDQVCALEQHLVRRSGPLWPASKHLLLSTGLRRAGQQSAGCDDLYMVPDSGWGLYASQMHVSFIERSFARIFLHHHAMKPINKGSLAMRRTLEVLGDRAWHISLGDHMTAGLIRNFGVAPDRIVKLGNAAVVTRQQFTPSTQCRTLGFLSNITREKGIATFLGLVRHLSRQNAPVHALIGGPVADPKIRAEIAAFCSEAPDQRRYLGAVHGPAKQAMLGQVDALIFPSTYANEAQPLTVFEALAGARPVLATPASLAAIKAPADWAIPPHRFIEDATSHVVNWIRRPAAFQQASGLAQQIWQRAKKIDEARFQTLAKVLA